MRLIVLFLGVAAFAQTPAPRVPNAGLEPAWDMSVVVQEIGNNASFLLPVLDKFDAGAWVAKGASGTFVEQLESSRQQARAVASEAQALARNPEKLSAALQLFFRLQGLETMLSTLESGARKYQSTELAQSLAALFGEGGTNRERFRGYIVNLAAERENQFEVMDREAQRCRGTLMAPQPPPKATGRKQ